jgi:hypothetical protein
MAGEAGDEEATWRDLVARYGTPAAADGVAPWPVREELPGAPPAPPGAPGPADAPGPMGITDECGASDAPATPGIGDPGTGRAPATGHGPGTGRDPVAGGARGNGQAGPPADGEDQDAAQPPSRGWDPVPGVIPAPPQTRVVRPAVPAPLPPAADDEHYVPPAPPPLPRLDPVTKGAWVALFGGPGYLLLAVLLGWVVPSWAGFCAVAAFVGGFATLVVRMGDRPPGDSGPDDGAVV